jgi:hypothetical protein
MIKIVNEETGKEVMKIKDNGDMVVEGNITIESDAQVTEAFEKAKKKEEE